jgi:hypothetical protein
MSKLGDIFGKARQAAADSASLPHEAPASITEGDPAESAPSAKNPFGGFKIGGSTSQAQPAATKSSAHPAAVAYVDPLDALAAEVDAMTRVAFPDHLPATAPQRELPADVTAAVIRFVENLDHLHRLTPEPELASSAIRQVMIELKHNQQYMDHVLPDDVRVIVRMMRETMGLTKIVKEKKASTRTAKRSDAVAAIMADLADLDDLM